MPARCPAPAPPATSSFAKAFDSLEPSDEVEDDLLDKAWGLEPNSRLSCQAIVDTQPLVIEIPRYSINMIKEGKR
jgi:2Fe-2S ferredoxin